MKNFYESAMVRAAINGWLVTIEAVANGTTYQALSPDTEFVETATARVLDLMDRACKAGYGYPES